MSSLKKIAISVCTFLIAILSFSTITRAVDNTQYTGDNVTLDYTASGENPYYANPRLFCISFSKIPPYGDYSLFTHIKIDGKKATNVKNGYTWENDSNVKLAYMLVNAKKDGIRENNSKSTLRALGWKYFNTWWYEAKSNGLINGDILVEGEKSFENNKPMLDELKNSIADASDDYKKLEEDANNYVTNVSIASIKIKETTPMITKTVQDGNEKNYTIGPFQCEFSNGLKNISLATDKGWIIPSSYIVGKNTGDINTIKSNENFYVNIKTKEDITKINKIRITGETVDWYGADLYVYKKVPEYLGGNNIYDEGQMQNFAYFIPYKNTYTPEDQYSFSTEVTGSLVIQKIDNSDGGKNVLGIGFKVFCNIPGQKGWLIIEDNKIKGRTPYFDEATTIETKSCEEKVENNKTKYIGKTEKITDIPLGRYDVWETKLPQDYQYMYSLETNLVPNGFLGGEVIQWSKKTATDITSKDIYGNSIVEAYNTPTLGSLVINKKDESNHFLKGIGFKIYSENENQWLDINNNGELIGYKSNFFEASELSTGDEGCTMQIKYLPAGDYRIYETSVGTHTDKYTLEYLDLGDQNHTKAKIKKIKTSEDNDLKKYLEVTVNATGIAQATICEVINITDTEIPKLGSLKISKKDESGNPLEGIGFRIYSEVENAWVNTNGSAVLTGYAEKFDEVSRGINNNTGVAIRDLITDSKGNTQTITQLPEGKYRIYETNIGQYGNLYSLEEVKVPGGGTGNIKKIKAKENGEEGNFIRVEVKAGETASVNTVEVYNFPNLGSLKIHKEDKDGNILKDIGFRIYSENEQKWLNINTKNGNLIGYVSTIDEVSRSIFTQSDGYTKLITGLPKGKYRIYEVYIKPYDDIYSLEEVQVPGGLAKIKKIIDKDNEDKGLQEYIEVEVKANGVDEASATICNAKNTPDLGSLQIHKTAEENNENLDGIGFKIYSNSEEKWLDIDTASGQLKGYSNDFKSIEDLVTGEDGKTQLITKLPKGKYLVYETKIDEKYKDIYSLEETQLVDGTTAQIRKIKIDGQTRDYIEVYVEPNGTANPKNCEVKNTKDRTKISLSGYVWEDIKSKKQDSRNNYFKSDTIYDTDDNLLDEIVVRLKYNDNVIEETKTENGLYTFNNIEINKLDGYSIEFEYSGLIYENIVVHVDAANGSKASEAKQVRTGFNNKFNDITKDKEIDGVKLEYTVQEATENEKAKSILKNGDKFTITSNTKNAGLNLRDKYQAGMDEIKDINLGLFKREQPYLTVVNDIDNVRIAVNGKEHKYNYKAVIKESDNYSDGFNVGVMFGKTRGNPYTRPIYKEDYNFNSGNKDKELKAYITYVIKISNKSTGLTSKVNSIVNYFDSRYELVSAGTEIDDKGNPVGNRIQYDVDDSYQNANYQKIVLNTDMIIGKSEPKYIYVQFSLDKKKIGTILFDNDDNNDLLYNVTEINSYETYLSENLYAGIDRYSRPGNADPDRTDEHELDTYGAPAFRIELADARKITGTVFLDSTSEELQVGQERRGNGIYDDGEKTISGVKVKLVGEDGEVKKETLTDENGNFELSGFIPGTYTIVYTWGDEKYTVGDYKGTIYKKERWNDSKWFINDVDTRYSDAIDDYGRRKDIDSEKKYTTMNSTTPKIDFGIEMTNLSGDGIPMTSGIDRVEFLVKNVDFGIVERPRQKIDISKDVTAFRSTVGDVELANVRKENGNFISEVDGKIIEPGKIKNFTVTPQDDENKSILKEELDNSLLNNTTVEIEYTITVANSSELDYDSEEYYKYGDKVGNIIRLKPVGVYDYLDKEIALNEDKKVENSKWTKVEPTVYTETINNTPTIIDEHLIGFSTITIDEMGGKIYTSGFKSEVEEYLGVKIEQWTASELTEFRQKMVADKTILRNEDLEGELEAGEKKEAKLYTSKQLSPTEEIDLNNSTEIIKVESNSIVGRKVTPITSKLFDSGERVTVTNNTGGNHDYVLPIALGVGALVILGAGVILIKKKVLDK